MPLQHVEQRETEEDHERPGGREHLADAGPAACGPRVGPAAAAPALDQLLNVTLINATGLERFLELAEQLVVLHIRYIPPVRYMVKEQCQTHHRTVKRRSTPATSAAHPQ